MNASTVSRIRRFAAVAVSSLALWGCGSQPPAPDWALNAEASARKATAAYLQGQQRVEALQWQKARQSIASTAEPAAMAQLELMRCAARVASLQWDDCPAYAALAVDAGPPQQAYARYLQASPGAADVALLPPAQQPIAQRIVAQEGGHADARCAAPEAQAVKEPLSRLLAAAVLLRAGQACAGLLQLGVDTASSQGWTRALMAWLLLQLRAAENSGDQAGAQAVQRRLQLLQQAGPPGPR